MSADPSQKQKTDTGGEETKTGEANPVLNRAFSTPLNPQNFIGSAGNDTRALAENAGSSQGQGDGGSKREGEASFQPRREGSGSEQAVLTHAKSLDEDHHFLDEDKDLQTRLHGVIVRTKEKKYTKSRFNEVSAQIPEEKKEDDDSTRTHSNSETRNFDDGGNKQVTPDSSAQKKEAEDKPVQSTN